MSKNGSSKKGSRRSNASSKSRSDNGMEMTLAKSFVSACFDKEVSESHINSLIDWENSEISGSSSSSIAQKLRKFSGATIDNLEPLNGGHTYECYFHNGSNSLMTRVRVSANGKVSPTGKVYQEV